MQPPAESTADLSEELTGAVHRRPEVILIGASIRAAAESARRAGFSVTGLDDFGDVDTRRVCQRYLSLADSSAPVDLAAQLPEAAAVVVVGGLGRVERLLRSLRQRHPVFGSPRREPACRYELAQLRRIAQASGVQVPPTFPPGQRPRAHGARRWLCKEIHSSGGLGVHWARANDFLAGARAWHQQWIGGRTLGAIFLGIAGSAVLLGVCRASFTRRSERPFTYAGSSGPLACSDRLESALVRFGNAYAADRSVTGLFNVDFILDRENRVWILEINRRWSASCEVIEAALVRAGRLQPPQTLFGWHCQAMGCAVGPSLPGAWSVASSRGRRSLCGAAGDGFHLWKRIVYCRRSGRFDPAKLPRVGAWGSVRFVDVPEPAARVRRGQPLLTLLCQENEHAPLAWPTKRRLIAAAQAAVVPER